MAVSVIAVLVYGRSPVKDSDLYMNTKLSRELIAILLLASVLAMAQSIAAVNAASSSIWGVREGQSMQWLITSSSNVDTMWFSETFEPRGNFSAPLGSTINLTIGSVDDGRLEASISIGQLALENVSMSEIAFNLVLGWYPFQPGLVCPINWDVQRQDATSNGFSVSESRIGFEDAIVFVRLNGTTGTMLVYDKATGLLMKGYGSFGQFLIEVALAPATVGGTTAILAVTGSILAVGFIVALALISSRFSSTRERRLPRHS